MKGSIRFNDAVNAEVTTDGTEITKVVNVATGEEYGGGGGGDFSTAEVTIINTSDAELAGSMPIVLAGDDEEMSVGEIPVSFGENNYTAILYKNCALLIVYDATITDSDGSVTIVGNSAYISGDCTITLEYAD